MGSKSTSLQQITTTSIDQKTAGADYATVLGAGAVQTNPDPEKVIVPVTDLLGELASLQASSNIESQRATAQAYRDSAATQAALTARAIAGLESQRARETSEIPVTIETVVFYLVVGFVAWKIGEAIL